MEEGEFFVLFFSDGIWFDFEDKLLKLWYYVGLGVMCYVISKDGIYWDKFKFDVVLGMNIVDKYWCDSNIVYFDVYVIDL